MGSRVGCCLRMVGASGEKHSSFCSWLWVFLPKHCCDCRGSVKSCKPGSLLQSSIGCCLFLCLSSTHTVAALFCCWQEGRASAKPMCQLELMPLCMQPTCGWMGEVRLLLVWLCRKPVSSLEAWNRSCQKKSHRQALTRRELLFLTWVLHPLGLLKLGLLTGLQCAQWVLSFASLPFPLPCCTVSNFHSSKACVLPDICSYSAVTCSW